MRIFFVCTIALTPFAFGLWKHSAKPPENWYMPYETIDLAEVKLQLTDAGLCKHTHCWVQENLFHTHILYVYEGTHPVHEKKISHVSIHTYRKPDMRRTSFTVELERLGYTNISYGL